MNKDIIELLKYIGKIILIYSMPFFLFFLIFAACKITNAIHLKYNAFSVFGIILVIVFAILTIDFYFTLPYKITRKALRENKSKYLNQFAQNFGLTTILLVLIIVSNFILYIFQSENAVCNILNLCLLFFSPLYFIIYYEMLSCKKIK